MFVPALQYAEASECIT